MDSDAEGVPSEFFDYFKVLEKKKKKNTFGFFFWKSSNQLVKFFRVIFHLWSLPFKFRFYAFKVFLLVVSMLSALFFLLRCCR